MEAKRNKRSDKFMIPAVQRFRFKGNNAKQKHKPFHLVFQSITYNF